MPINSLWSEGRSEHLYFAFGSNLQLDQMRLRCPNSRYIGRAQLHNYRFQINSRGYANILVSAGDCVEGLVYLLTADDELRLDKNEGVSMKLYDKLFLPIEVYTASINLVGRLVADVAQQLKNHRPDYSHPKSFMIAEDYLDQRPKARQQDSNQQQGKRRLATVDELSKFISPTPQGQITKALVYVSLRFQKEGQIRDEYVKRMNAGITDARKLGVSDLYFKTCLRPYIPEQPWPSKELLSVQKRRLPAFKPPSSKRENEVVKVSAAVVERRKP